MPTVRSAPDHVTYHDLLRFVAALTFLFLFETASAASSSPAPCQYEPFSERNLVQSYLEKLSAASATEVQLPHSGSSPILIHAFALEEVHRTTDHLDQLLRYHGLVEGSVNERISLLSAKPHLNHDALADVSILERDFIAAVNLVVETGIYNRRWTRIQAIRYIRSVMGTDLMTAKGMVDKGSLNKATVAR